MAPFLKRVQTESEAVSHLASGIQRWRMCFNWTLHRKLLKESFQSSQTGSGLKRVCLAGVA